MLRPGYIPPSRISVGGKILNDVYEKEIEVCKNVLEGKIVNLDIDGWSNIQNELVVCASVITTDEGKEKLRLMEIFLSMGVLLTLLICCPMI